MKLKAFDSKSILLKLKLDADDLKNEIRHLRKTSERCLLDKCTLCQNTKKRIDCLENKLDGVYAKIHYYNNN